MKGEKKKEEPNFYLSKEDKQTSVPYKGVYEDVIKKLW